MTAREIYLRETGRTAQLVREGYIRFVVVQGGKLATKGGKR